MKDGEGNLKATHSNYKLKAWKDKLEVGLSTMSHKLWDPAQQWFLADTQSAEEVVEIVP